MQRKARATAPHLNKALDDMKGNATDQYLADLLGCTYRTIMRWRDGETEPNSAILLRFPSLYHACIADRMSARPSHPHGHSTVATPHA